MRNTLYIDIDEEMIAVIGRLRKSHSRENALAVPKRALILQSVVNLRLLQREAEKLGKSIILVTQDDQGRLLAERAGLATQSFLEESAREGEEPMVSDEMPPEEHVQETSNVSRVENAIASLDEGEGRIRPPQSLRADSVGSSSFFASGPLPSAIDQMRSPVQVPAQSAAPKKILVRDFSPKNLTALNSKMPLEPRRPEPVASFERPQPQLHQLPSYFLNEKPGKDASRSASLPAASSVKPVAPSQSSRVQSPVRVSGGKKIKTIVFFFVLLSVLSLSGVGAYIFLPKATLELSLKTSKQNVDVEFQGSEGAEASFEAKTLPIRFIEQQGETSLSLLATGVSSLSDRKARGMVTLTNTYSSAPQLLVASTRLLSSDGKLFRITSDVTVPGMTGSGDQARPGSIEVQVVADQPGAEYNISPTTFTIPGLQGSPKYTKFSATSVQVMTGGGIGASDTKAVSEEDIAKAKKQIAEKVVEASQSLAEQSLLPGEKMLSEAVDTKVVSALSSIPVGGAAQDFEYRVTFTVRAAVFSEDALRDIFQKAFTRQNEAKQPAVTVDFIALDYGEPNADFEKKTLRIKAHAEAVLLPRLNTEQLVSDLLGKDEEEITAIIQAHPQIERATVTFWPDFLVSQVPGDAKRVDVIVKTNEKASK